MKKIKENGGKKRQSCIFYVSVLRNYSSHDALQISASITNGFQPSQIESFFVYMCVAKCGLVINTLRCFILDCSHQLMFCAHIYMVTATSSSNLQQCLQLETLLFWIVGRVVFLQCHK